MIPVLSLFVFCVSLYALSLLRKNHAKTHVIKFNTVEYEVMSAFKYRSKNFFIPLHANLDSDILAVASTIASDIGAPYKGPMPKLDQIIFTALDKTFEDQALWFAFNITSVRSFLGNYEDIDVIGR